MRDGASPSAPASVRCFFFFRFLQPPLAHRAHACELRSTKLGAFVFFTRAGENNIIIIIKKGRAITSPENVIDSHYTHKDPGAITTPGKLVTMKMNGCATTQ